MMLTTNRTSLLSQIAYCGAIALRKMPAPDAIDYFAANRTGTFINERKEGEAWWRHC
jgi:hypothetical protein